MDPRTIVNTQSERAEPPPNDDALVHAIAERREEEAFAELYRRHEQAAYSLALHMLRQTDAAEVAVQEAMLRLWRSADKYRYDKNARQWLLRIVATECMRVLRLQRRQAARFKPMRFDAHDPAGRPAREPGLHTEAMEGLRRCMERMPDTMRQMISLYYMAGLTQKEIGDEMALSQQAVSNHLRDALKFLRTELTKAGLAAALPLISEASLGEVLGAVHTPPAGMQASMREALKRPAPDPAREVSRAASRRTAPPSFALPAAMGFVLAGLALGIYLGMSGDPLPATAPKAALASAPAAPDSPQPLHHAWSFETGVPNGFVQIHGMAPHFIAARGKIPAGLFFYDTSLQNLRPEEPTVYRIPITVPRGPLLFEASISLDEANFPRPKDSESGYRVSPGFEFEWLAAEEVPVRATEEYAKRLKPFKLPALLRKQTYFFGPYLASFVDGELSCVKVYAEPYTSDALCMKGFGYVLHNIEVRAIAEDDLPESLDPEGQWLKDVRAATGKPGTGWTGCSRSGNP